VNAELSDYDTIAVGPDGTTLYVADYWNGRIRKVANGIITAVAGGGINTGDGPAESAQLNNPTGLAVDSSGNLYFAEPFNNRVRRISNGIVTTIAGNGTVGFGGDGGAALDAELDFPTGVAVDGAGNVYIADTQNDKIRKVSEVSELSNDVITTFAGTGTRGRSGDGGPAELALLNLPAAYRGIATDAAGNLYIPDWEAVRMVSNGLITTVAGMGPQSVIVPVAKAPALSFPLALPVGVATGLNGNLYVADGGWTGAHGGIVVKVSSGEAATVAGGGSDLGDGGPAAAGQFYAPSGAAMDSSGALYVADTNDDRIRRVKEGILTTVVGTGAISYEGDSEGDPAVNAGISTPTAVTTDASGNFYLAEGGTGGYIHKVSQGIFTTIAENGPLLPNQGGAAKIGGSGEITGLVASATGDLYFTEASDNTVRKLSGGAITTVAGSGTAGYSGDNRPAQGAQLDSPLGLAIDAASNLYIADSMNGAVRKVTNGIITTVAAGLVEPTAIAVDGEGTLYVADAPFVRKVSHGQITNPLAGDATGGTQLARPAGLVVDPSGCLYVSDSTNNRILVLGTGSRMPPRRARRMGASTALESIPVSSPNCELAQEAPR
jgi:sugar lactone lactonase YvrE